MKIPLTKGEFAIVDEEDYNYLLQWNWHCVLFNKKTKVPRRARSKNDPESPAFIHMHKVVGQRMGLTGNIRHRDHNLLNNCRTNLFEVTPSQHAMYRRKVNYPTTSRYKGVYWTPKGKWRVRIFAFGKAYYLGAYKDEEDAAAVYNAAAKKFHGTFATLNKCSKTIDQVKISDRVKSIIK
jgi:hypothetical protein